MGGESTYRKWWAWLLLGALAAAGPAPALAIGRRRTPPPPPPPPSSTPDAATLVGHDLPASMTAGASVEVAITLRNTGTSTWTRGQDGFKLGAVGDAGGDARRFGPGRIRLPDGAAIAPGQEHTFRFDITAPGAGTFEPRWRMVHENVRWFGAEAARTVTVTAPAAPPVPAVDITANRLAALRMLDRRFRVDREDPSVPTPNLRLRYDHHEHYYQDKVAAIFGLVDMGQAPRSRLAEANRLLRYQMFSPRFRPTSAGHLAGDSGRWMHRSRSLGMRLWLLFAKYMDADIEAEHRQRFGWMLRDPFVNKSENIKLTNNSSYYLAHEIEGATGRASFRNVKGWLVGYLKGHGNDGTHEWGGPYNAWTLVAILNLAEFARDQQVRELATMVVDQYLARALTMSIGGNVATASVRTYGFWAHNEAVKPQTYWNRLLFTPDGFDEQIWADFVVSNYAPLVAHVDVFARSRGAPYSARFGDHAGGAVTWRHHFYKGDDFAIGTHRTVGFDGYRLASGGTHDIVGCFVQSAKDVRHKVVPFGHAPAGGPKKRRQVDERYFGYQNIAFVNNGGSTRAVWAGGGLVRSTPARLNYHPGFRLELQGGWAFLSDGRAYVAWAPTRGDPVVDPDSASYVRADRGRWLRSTHVPGDEGETSVIEVGDAASYGGYAAFKSEVLSRNARPRYRNGAVSYVARDGKVIDFGAYHARIDGQDFDPAAHPRAEGPNVRGATITGTNGTITLDFDRVLRTGPTDRVRTSHVFGR